MSLKLLRLVNKLLGIVLVLSISVSVIGLLFLAVFYQP